MIDDSNHQGIRQCNNIVKTEKIVPNPDNRSMTVNNNKPSKGFLTTCHSFTRLIFLLLLAVWPFVILQKANHPPIVVGWGLIGRYPGDYHVQRQPNGQPNPVIAFKNEHSCNWLTKWLYPNIVPKPPPSTLDKMGSVYDPIRYTTQQEKSELLGTLGLDTFQSTTFCQPTIELDNTTIKNWFPDLYFVYSIHENQEKLEGNSNNIVSQSWEFDLKIQVRTPNLRVKVKVIEDESMSTTKIKVSKVVLSRAAFKSFHIRMINAIETETMLKEEYEGMGYFNCNDDPVHQSVINLGLQRNLKHESMEQAMNYKRVPYKYESEQDERWEKESIAQDEFKNRILGNNNNNNKGGDSADADNVEDEGPVCGEIELIVGRPEDGVTALRIMTLQGPVIALETANRDLERLPSFVVTNLVRNVTAIAKYRPQVLVSSVLGYVNVTRDCRDPLDTW